MKILYLIKQTPDETLRKFIEEHERANDVAIVNINEDKDYDRIVDDINSADRIISW